MKLELNVDVHHLTRVEGHGNIVVKVRGGKVDEARWDVVETPRYFEAMLRGKHYTSAGILTARICGICSIGHCLASVRASEQAFGVEVPELATKLRLLAKHGETLQSHALHLYFLAAPDFVGLPSAIPLIETNPAVVGIAAKIKGLGNRLCEAVAGRATHPVSIQVGGMARVPDKKRLRELRDELVALGPALTTTVELFQTFKIPAFSRATEFVSLKGDKSYPWVGGDLVSSDGVHKSERDYRAMTNEWVDERNTSKWCKLSRASFATGALARLNNNYALLGHEAQVVAKAFGLLPVCHNPFMNTVAQLVELVHVVYESIVLIDELGSVSPNASTMGEVVPRVGRGVGAVEVPRGILYHEYEYDKDGYVKTANCIIPTTQNNLNIHHDLRALAEHYAPEEGMTDAKLELLCAMLVRSYDPCISCSVH